MIMTKMLGTNACQGWFQHVLYELGSNLLLTGMVVLSQIIYSLNFLCKHVINTVEGRIMTYQYDIFNMSTL